MSDDLQWTPLTTYRPDKVTHLRQTARITKPHTMKLAGLTNGEDPDCIAHAFLSRLHPGGFIRPHLDHGPFYERWHYPLEPAGTWWNTNGATQPTEPFPARHWEPHAAWNNTNKTRLHLIVDFDMIAHTDDQPFTPLPIDPFPELIELIDNPRSIRT